MKKTGTLLRNHWLFALFILLYLVFSLITYKDYGVSFDEPDEYFRGQLLYQKIRGNDKILQADFVINKGEANRDLLYYNHVYQAVLFQLNKLHTMEGYHLLNMLLAVILFVATYLLLYRDMKTKLAILGPLFLVFTPRLFSDIPNNPKDVPFAISFMVSLLAIYMTRELEIKRKVLVLGICFGISTALRFIGYVIFPIYIIYELYLNFGKKVDYKWKEFGLEIIIIGFICFLINLITLPYLGADPYNHFFELMRVSSKFPWGGSVLLFGKSYDDLRIPWFYLPVWFLITTPLYILTFTVCSIFVRKSKAYVLLLISLCVNIAVFILVRPVVYDGIRHIDYLLAIVSVMSSYSAIRLLSKKTKLFRFLTAGLIILNILFVNVSWVKLYPYGYTYFNELIGGIRGAYGKFETDYWGESTVEAFKWLERYTKEKNIPLRSVGVCGKTFMLSQYKNGKNLDIVGMSPENASRIDYAICWERWNDNKAVTGRLLHTIVRDKIPLIHIYQMKP